MAYKTEDTVEIIFPIKWKELGEADLECYIIEEVTFTGDFGPFRKDEEVECLIINFTTGTMTETDKHGSNLRVVKFKCVPL